uniref:ABC transporter domain-containing protein n=1 Tax=Zea mays TaxID=4577 RepID=A0A804NRY5_MAIZE
MTRLEDEVRHMLSARALDLEIEAPSGLTLLSMASDRSNSNATKAVVGEEDDGSVSSFVGRRSSYRSLQSIREIDLFPADAISDLHTKVRSLGQATRSVTAFAEGQGAAHRMFKIIERKPDIDIDDNTGIILEDVKGDVQLKDVYFSYPTRPEHLIFDGFSLQVPSGTTMALVGDSGSGKSTVISLVERFYDPHAGEVLIDGVDI